MRIYTSPASQWQKVKYEANFWQRHFYRAGTATSAQANPVGLVRSRVQFLCDCSSAANDDDNDDKANVLPPYHAIHANGECVAVWCRTGTWATLQVTSWLVAAAACLVKSTVTLSSATAATQVTVPAAGLWGWLGYTTQVSLLSTQPWILPALAAYGTMTIGGPALWLALSQRKARQITEQLNNAFWEAAIERPEIFVEAILQWSTSNEQQYETKHSTAHSLASQGSVAETTSDVEPLKQKHSLSGGEANEARGQTC